MGGSQAGLLLMADISGYSVYLTHSELEHARETLGALLSVLVDTTKPPLAVSKLEGDAVLSFAPASAILSGQTVVEMVEATYVAFRRAIDLMVLNNTCGCNACANISTLDLKFLAHYGEFVIQEVAGRMELFGPAVVLIHRMLKNDVVQRTGFSAYTAYTEAAVGFIGAELLADSEVVDLDLPDVGRQRVWVVDMHPVWEARRDESLIDLADDETYFAGSIDVPLSPETVWGYLTNLEFRKILMGSDRQEVVSRRGGRVSEGTTIRCYHGDQIIDQLVLEWHPFEKVVTRDRVSAFGGRVDVIVMFVLQSDGEGGSVLTVKIGGATGPALLRTASRVVLRFQQKQRTKMGARFRDAVMADFRQQPHYLRI